MLSSLVIVFREVLEAALVLGVLLAATRTLPGRGHWVAWGSAVGLLGAGLVALFMEVISGAIAGMGQEVFNAVVLFLAAALIGWHVVWMKRTAGSLVQELKQVGQKIVEGRAPLYALAVVSGLAVLREGAEIMLFLYGILASGQPFADVVLGGTGGLLLGVVISVFIYFGLVRIPTKHIFSVTSVILTLLAAGMVSHGLNYLSAVGAVPTLTDPLWDTSRFLPENGLLGQLLHVLIGYNESPSGTQAIGYVLTIIGVMVMMKLFGKPPVNRKKNVTGFKNKVETAVILFIFAGILGFSSDAHATKKVYSPYVELGELEFEYRGSYAFDDRASKDEKQKHKFAVGYGVTERWFTEVYGIVENHPGNVDDGLEYEATEWENRFQLSEQGEYWADLGFLLELEFADADQNQNEVKLVPLFEKEWDQWRHRANPFVEYKYAGEDEDEWEAGVNWSSTLRISPFFEPGLEIYWNYGDLDESRSFDEQSFQMGPVIYGHIGEHIKYDVGYLFGVSESPADGELKWIFEFEWHF